MFLGKQAKKIMSPWILKCDNWLTQSQSASASSPLRRIGREVHYPPGVVDVMEPYILLVHQGVSSLQALLHQL